MKAVENYQDFPVVKNGSTGRTLSQKLQALDRWGDNYSEGENLCQLYPHGGFFLSPITGSEAMPCTAFRRTRLAHCTTPYTLQQESAAEPYLSCWRRNRKPRVP
jgi:hypothetical protein